MRKMIPNCLFLVFAVGLPSQAVHLVGTGGHPDVGAALAVAAPGDVIRVESGDYPPFTVTIPVTIRGMPDASGVGPRFVGAPPVVVDVPTGDSVQLSYLRFDRVAVDSGRAVFDDCVFVTAGTGLGAATSMLHVQSATVHLVGCSFQSSSPFAFSHAVRAIDADVTVLGSTLLGSFGLYPAAAVHLSDSRLFGSDAWLHGGGGLSYASAIVALGGSQVWLTDSHLVCDSSVCPVQSSGQLVRLDRCTQLGGGFATCAAPAAGTPQLGVAELGELGPGAPFGLTFSLEPGGVVFVLAGFELATIDAPPLLAQPSWLTISTAFVDAALLTDADGTASYSVTLPNLPSIVDASIWFEGIGFASGGLQVSPLVGGVVR